MRFLVFFLLACFLLPAYTQTNFDFTRDTFELNKTVQLEVDKIYSYNGSIDFDHVFSNKLLFNTSNPLTFPYHSVFDNQIVFVQNNTKIPASYCSTGGSDFIRIPVNKNLSFQTNQIEHIGLKNFSDSSYFNDGQLLYNHTNLEIGYLSQRLGNNIYKHYDVVDVNNEGCNNNKKLHITSKKIKRLFSDNGVPSFSFSDSLLDISLYDDSNIIYDISTLSNGNKVFLKFLNLSKNATVEVYNTSNQLISQKTLLPTLSNPDSNYLFEYVSIKNDSVILGYFKAPNDSVHRLKVFNLNGNLLYNYTSPITNVLPLAVRFNELNNTDALVYTDMFNSDSSKRLYYLVQKDRPTKEFYISSNFYQSSAAGITRLINGDFIELAVDGQMNKYMNLLDTAGNLKKRVPLRTISPAGSKFADLSADINNPKIASDSLGNLFLLAPKNDFANPVMPASYLWITKVPYNVLSIEGTVYVDLNKNCVIDNNEYGVGNWLVELQQHNTSKYTLTATNGYYSFQADTGTYQVILHKRNTLLFDTICQPVLSGRVLSAQIIPDKADFLVKPTNCYAPSKLNIEVFGNPLVKCRSTTFTVQVKNEGQSYAANPYVDIKLDTLLTFQSTSHSNYVQLSPKLFRFYLDTLYEGQQYSFTFNAQSDCGVLLGSAHCVDAKVYPKINCKSNPAAYLTAAADCLGDSIVFEIKNLSTNATVANKKYLILENDSIVQQNTYQLGGNQNKKIGIKNQNAATYRLITYQDPATPTELADSVLTTAIEGCTHASTYATGYITNVVPSDNIANEDIFCSQVVSSYDPNDKLASPVGFSTEHLIEKAQAINYTLRFQNTGNYYAYDIVLVDSLSSNLDVNTLKYIGASHSYNAVVTNNVLKVTFSNILLPWKSYNEPKSNGFFSFQIQPKSSVRDGDKILNKALIYFDSNAPVATNTTFHTIGTDFIKVKIVSAVKNNMAKVKSSIYPNPFSQTATLSFTYNQSTQLTILSLDGKIIKQYTSESNTYTVDRNTCSNGLYLYELRNMTTGELLDTGKIIIE